MKLCGNRAGLSVNRVKVWVYVLADVLSTLAGGIVTARLDFGQPNTGLGYEMDDIAAVVMGGCHSRVAKGRVGHGSWVPDHWRPRQQVSRSCSSIGRSGSIVDTDANSSGTGQGLADCVSVKLAMELIAPAQPERGNEMNQRKAPASPALLYSQGAAAGWVRTLTQFMDESFVGLCVRQWQRGPLPIPASVMASRRRLRRF